MTSKHLNKKFIILFILELLFLFSISGVVFTSDTDLSIQVADGVLSVDIVDENGAFVENPSVNMSSLTFSFEDQSTSGVLGTSKEKIRLSNPTSNPEWSVSIAATDGINAKWTDGVNYMDYNSSTAGRLSVNPSEGFVFVETKTDDVLVKVLTDNQSYLPKGIFLGSDATFEYGIVDSITLFSANSDADVFVQYDLTNVVLSQFVPGKQPSANYTLNLTLTAI